MSPSHVVNNPCKYPSCCLETKRKEKALLNLALQNIRQSVEPLRRAPNHKQHHPQHGKLGRLDAIRDPRPHIRHEAQPLRRNLAIQLILPLVTRRAELPRVVGDHGVEHAPPAPRLAVADEVAVQHPAHPVVVVDGPGEQRGGAAAAVPRQEAQAEAAGEKRVGQAHAEVGDGGVKVPRVAARPGDVRERVVGEEAAGGGEIGGLARVLVAFARMR